MRKGAGERSDEMFTSKHLLISLKHRPDSDADAVVRKELHRTENKAEEGAVEVGRLS